MIVYIIMLLITIMFMYISTKVQKKWLKIICYIIAGLPLFLVSAFRYDVGTDYLKRYDYDFNTISQGKDVKNLEIGFKGIIKFCLLFTQESYLLFIITSAITISAIMYIIIKKSKNPILSVLIFVLAGFFFDSLNIVRQFLAMSIVFVGYPFLLENKKMILYIGCVLLAGALHSTAFIMFLLVFLNKKMLANWKWVIPISVLILILNDNLFKLIEIVIENTRFNVYLTGKLAKGEVSFLFIGENLMFYIFMYYIYIKNKKIGKIEKQDILFLNIQALALLMMVSGVCHMLLIRIALYFSVFQIVSVPYYISKMPTREIIDDIKNVTKNKINLEKVENKIPKYTTILITLCLIFVFTRTNIMSNTNEVLPYKTILNKEISIK